MLQIYTFKNVEVLYVYDYMAMEHPMKIFVEKKSAYNSELTGSINLIINKIHMAFINKNQIVQSRGKEGIRTKK